MRSLPVRKPTISRGWAIGRGGQDGVQTRRYYDQAWQRITPAEPAAVALSEADSADAGSYWFCSYGRRRDREHRGQEREPRGKREPTEPAAADSAGTAMNTKNLVEAGTDNATSSHSDDSQLAFAGADEHASAEQAPPARLLAIQLKPM